MTPSLSPSPDRRSTARRGRPGEAQLTHSSESTCPDPGIYEDVALREYLRWDAVSSSFLKAMRRSPAHAKYERDHQEWTESLKLGDAIHLLALQPTGFRERYARGEQCWATTGSKQRCSRAGTVSRDGHFFCTQHAAEGEATDLEVLTPAQWERVNDTADSILASEPASILLNDDGDIELSIVWDDPHTGLRCKARIDKLCRGAKTITDIKTTQDAEPESFQRSIYNYGYEIQAAHYLNGCVALKLDEPQGFGIIAAETEPYHGVSVYEMDFNTIAVGCKQIHKLMPIIAKCRKDESWPGYNPEIIKIGLSQWQEGQLNRKVQP